MTKVAKKVSSSYRQAFGEGYMAAIYRKSDKSNPYEDGESRLAWHKGHERGSDVVEYHAKSARRGSNPDTSDLW